MDGVDRMDRVDRVDGVEAKTAQTFAGIFISKIYLIPGSRICYRSRMNLRSYPSFFIF